MQNRLIQLYLFFITIFLSLTASLYSVHYFPYLTIAEREEIFFLGFSILLFIMPILFLIAVFREVR